MNNFLVYLLFHTNKNVNETYVGYTNKFSRRIRQHNCEIKGGARATSKMKNKTGKWMCYLQIQNLTKSEALSIERKIKNGRRRAKGKTPLMRRLYVIEKLGYKYKQFNYFSHRISRYKH